jgi:FAD/FMN-containing dehydrogenase
MLYSTDASNYQIEPVGVVIPKSLDDAQAAVELASSHGVPILPRGGGSSLAGQCVGAALVIDFSKYLSRVLDLDVEACRVTVEPGINLDLLNKQLKPNGLMFGPDPSSSNRATVYGMTSDHVAAVRITLPEGGTVELGPGTDEDLAALAAVDDSRGRLLRSLLGFRERHRDLIARDFPPHWRRATGYSLDQFLKPDGEFNPARLIVASEGTLATTLQVTLNLVPTPKMTGLVRDADHPRGQTVGDRVDGPNADRPDPVATRLRQPDRLHPRRSGRHPRRRVLRRERGRTRGEV